MKRTLLALALLAALTGCASGGSSSNDRVGIDFEQLVGGANVMGGTEFEVQFALTVENRLAEPITITRVEIRQVGQGAYSLTRRNPPSIQFNKRIPPGSSDGVDFWMHAYQNIHPGELGGDEPITIRASVFFEAPSGAFRQVVHKTFDPN